MSGLEHFRPCVKAQLMECSLYAKRFLKKYNGMPRKEQVIWQLVLHIMGTTYMNEQYCIQKVLKVEMPEQVVLDL